MKEVVLELDSEDLKEYRRLYSQRECGIMYNVPMSLDKATAIELAMIEFQAYVYDKYIVGEDIDTDEREWFMDEVSGEIYLWG